MKKLDVCDKHGNPDCMECFYTTAPFSCDQSKLQAKANAIIEEVAAEMAVEEAQSKLEVGKMEKNWACPNCGKPAQPFEYCSLECEPPASEGWEEEFDEKFKATGAEIIGFKRHEYPNLREHQFEEVKDFIRLTRQEARREVLEEAKKIIKFWKNEGVEPTETDLVLENILSQLSTN